MSSSAPFVSTIIPTYNRARDVVRAVESALAQTYPRDRHEILVVDDGSRDEGATEAALRGHAEAGRIRYLRKENGGVSSARNHGMAQARGDLFAFLDSDDEWLPEKLATQVTFLSSRAHCGLCLTDYIRIDEERRPTGRSHLRRYFEDDRPNMVQALRFPGLPPTLMLVRRNVVDEVGLFDTGLRTAEDIDFQLRVARRFGIGHVDEPLARYRMGHEDGLSHGRDTYADFMRVITRFVDRHQHELDDEARAQVMLENHVRNARGLIVGGWYAEGARLAVRAVRYVRRVEDALSVARLAWVLPRAAAGHSARRVLARG